MKIKSLKAMTILESSMAIMILSVVLAGILSGLYVAGNIGAITKNRAKVIQILKAKMEEIISLSYAEVEDETITPLYLYNNPDRIEYTLNISVLKEYEDGQEAGKEILIRADWVQQDKTYYEDLVTYRIK